jgi:glycosyltransferase involved in cell wall biosynthesis
MANLGFVFCPNVNWVGGKNYFISMFQELNRDINDNDSIIVFSGMDSCLDDLNGLENLKVVKTKLLNQSGFFNFFYKACNEILGRNVIIMFYLKYYNIDILSHDYIPKWTGVNCLPWIPDFQHCFLKDLFSDAEIKKRNRTYRTYLNNENFLLSSNSALQDAECFFEIKGKPFIYRFYPLISNDFDFIKYSEIAKKYKIEDEFVFLPNQFWKHKNHLVCFEACKIARDSGAPFKLVCTGGFSDYRHPEYSSEITDFIIKNNLDDYIILLGLVDRDTFNCLLHECAVLVNPSKFEGWSTTVEEGKAFKKAMVLSDLNVHREQCETIDNVRFFINDNAHECFNEINSALCYSESINSSDRVIVKDKRVSIYEILLDVIKDKGLK